MPNVKILIIIIIIYMKTLAIVIRAHGMIPIHYAHGKTVPEIFNPSIFNYKTAFNIESITSITLAKLGGICYGSPDVESYSKIIRDMKDRLREQEHVNNTDELIEYLFNTKKSRSQLLDIHNLNKQIFDKSYPPEIMTLGDNAIEKIYTYDASHNTGLGVYFLSSNHLTGTEHNAIINRLNQLNEQLRRTGQIYKSQILGALSEFHLYKLYYIDFSCFGLYSVLNVPLTEADANWIISVMEHDKLKGGERKIKERKKRLVKKQVWKKRMQHTKKRNNTKKRNKTNKKLKTFA